MIRGVLGRLFNFAIAEDEAVNAILGGDPRQTVSGTLGRGLAAGKWWAAVLVPLVNLIVWVATGQRNHCQATAAAEARWRDVGGA